MTVFFAAMICGVSCVGDPEPCPGVETGATIEISILGINASTNHAADCYEAWGVGQQTFQATVVRLTGDETCQAGVPEIEHLGDWSLALDPGFDSEGGGVKLEGRYSMQNGACSGTLRLSLNGDLPCDAAAGDECTLLFNASFDPGQGNDCPEACGGLLDVSATQL